MGRWKEKKENRVWKALSFLFLFFFLSPLDLFIQVSENTLSTSSPPPNTLPLPPLRLLPLFLPHHSQEQSGLPALWEIQVPSPSIQVQEGEHPNRAGSQKASPCRRNKTQCQCQWLLSLHLDLGGSVSPHVSHIQRIRFDHMLVQSQSSWTW